MAMCLILDAMEARALVAFQEYIPKFPLGPAELAREPRVDVVQLELGRGGGAGDIAAGRHAPALAHRRLAFEGQHEIDEQARGPRVRRPTRDGDQAGEATMGSVLLTH